MIALALAVASLAPQSQSPAPRLTGLQPAGASRGAELELTLRGERLAAAAELLLDRSGLEVLGFGAAAADRCTVRLRVPADCALGPHALRLRSPAGVSNLLLFHVGALPAIAEQRLGTAPQPVPLGCTIDGVLQDGEHDRYHVHVPAATCVRVEVEAMRLGLQALDTRLVVRGPDGAELARADDTALGLRDPWLAFHSDRGGTCELELAHAVPAEGRAGAYRLHVGTFPRPVGALPCGGQPGEELEVTLLDALGDGPPATARVRLPDDGSEWYAWHPELPGGIAPTPILLRVGGPPNRTAAAGEGGAEPRMELPGAVHGVVATADQPVRFRWAGTKGREVELRVLARALRSPLDPVLTVRAADGRVLAGNDDGPSRDSVLRFTPPADGDFVAEVRDLLRRGGPDLFFRLEIGPRDDAPRLQVQAARGIDPVAAVPQGGHAALLLQPTNLAAPLALDGLPAGVTAEFGPRLPRSTVVPVLFAATADAPLAGALLRVGGEAAGGVDARMFRQVLPLLTGRNDTPLLQFTARTVPLVVAQRTPFELTAGTPAVPAVRGASVAVPLTLTRRDGFDGRVRVRALWLPPGLSAGQTNLDRGATAGVLAIEAAADAPLGEFPCLLAGSMRRDNLGSELALPFVRVRVEAPWLELARATVRTAQGRSAELRLAVTRTQPQHGPATATLLGLPRGVAAASATLTADAAELVFTLQIAADAAVGRHRNVVVELQLPDAEQRPVPHRLPAGELRIDAAPPSTAPAGVAEGSR